MKQLIHIMLSTALLLSILFAPVMAMENKGQEEVEGLSPAGQFRQALYSDYESDEETTTSFNSLAGSSIECEAIAHLLKGCETVLSSTHRDLSPVVQQAYNMLEATVRQIQTINENAVGQHSLQFKDYKKILQKKVHEKHIRDAEKRAAQNAPRLLPQIGEERGKVSLFCSAIV